MITYLYWLLLAAIIFAVLFSVGVRMGKWKPALILAVLLWLVGTGLYYFWLEQIFVKRLGGTMTVTVPEGQQHIAATWKGDNLWIENYNPETNECLFREYSRGNLLEGKVVIKNCSPTRAQAPAASTGQPHTSL
ncbi:hypothetical protein [Alloalcanivorax mobilis]|uniref:hypothetical protein n=1 Tax=Alloalcanivorax mobilis TaxID=2019569 RepID=UPI000B5B16C8|nr:hypothetical protein [Alloalcanivorax mobilis]ASK33180.1 hypothetical protein CEK62_01650 [Alcanivorax sp. N3-2A]ASK36998.1 hypothetical protein CEK62_21845 [Alcanivorax sp. N3-2A]|tara:strand:+ start:3594 stop:3995 length:402 start_codon:yes stop_codon:yes gene_type:complete